MSKRAQKFLIGIVAAAVGLAAWWAITTWKGQRLATNNKVPSGAVTLRLLSIQGILPPTLVERFQSETGVHLAIDEVATADEIWTRILETETPAGGGRDDLGTDTDTEGESAAATSRLYDVISLFSFQAPAAIRMDRLANLDFRHFSNRAALSADFTDLPGVTGAHRFIPLLWGLTGFLFDATQWKQGFPSWESVFAEPKLKKKIHLLDSPIDILYLLARRFPDSKGLELFEHEGGPDEYIGELKKMLTKLAADTRLLNSSPFATATIHAESELPRDGSVIQIAHGEAASLVGEKNGLKNSWQFVVPEEKALMWILSYAITEGTPHMKEAVQFVDFLLDRQVALQLTQASRQASANRFVEDQQDLHPWLKPSYLRQVPLNRIHMIHDFHAGLALRAAIQSIRER